MLNSKWKKQVPVYVFTGFLESGKTTFLNESMADNDFVSGERNLVILCEEGEKETAFSESEEIKKEYVEEEDSISKEYFSSLNENIKPEKVLIEYNGMWTLQKLYENLPQNWTICQEMTFANSQTFISYNTNMRNLVYDKLKFADMVVFNRMDDEKRIKELHKIVRIANRSAQIIYENCNGEVQVDDIEDPLPFDIEKNVIDLKDRDFGYWYRDINFEPEKYKGKEIIVSGIVKSKHIKGEDKFAIGRPLMICCAEDIEFAGIRCIIKGEGKLRHNQWGKISGIVAMGHSKAKEGKVPVIVVNKIEYEQMPEDVLATFY